MSHLTLIESPQSSEVENYMQKVLRSGDTQAATVAAGNAKNDQLNGGDGAHKEVGGGSGGGGVGESSGVGFFS